MLTPYQRPQFLSKIFTDASGRQFRLTFFVAMVDGELKGRLVSAEPISASVARLAGQVSDGTFCLPCASGSDSSFFLLPSSVSFVSPYFSLDYLINSQPTRAPSRA